MDFGLYHDGGQWRRPSPKTKPKPKPWVTKGTPDSGVLFLSLRRDYGELREMGPNRNVLFFIRIFNLFRDVNIPKTSRSFVTVAVLRYPSIFVHCALHMFACFIMRSCHTTKHSKGALAALQLLICLQNLFVYPHCAWLWIHVYKITFIYSVIAT